MSKADTDALLLLLREGRTRVRNVERNHLTCVCQHPYDKPYVFDVAIADIDLKAVLTVLEARQT